MAKVIKSKDELPNGVVNLGLFHGSREYIMAMAGLIEKMHENMIFVSPAHVFVLFEDLHDPRSPTLREPVTGLGTDPENPTSEEEISAPSKQCGDCGAMNRDSNLNCWQCEAEI